MFDKNNKNGLLDEHLTDIIDETTLVDRYIWVRAVVFFIIGGLVGGITVSFRPYFEDWIVHLEALVGLGILIGLNLGLLRYFIQNKRKWYRLAYSLCVCAVWGGYALGWLSLAVYFLDDVIMMNVMFALIGLVTGYVSFFLHDKWLEERGK